MELSSPTEFTYWVGVNRKVNADKIHPEVKLATKKWDDHDYEAFGFELGEIAYQIFVGEKIGST